MTLERRNRVETVQWRVNKRCQILGLDGARKIEYGGEVGENMSNVHKAALIGAILAN